ncbi:MAG: putative integral rane proteinase [Rickettsiaceae bacterium]|jgi:membrane protease subunit HflK|nr:putative integral rane proteinase [Rickettsiaceae bacterium]
MPWDNNNGGNDNGPWGQAPKNEPSGGKQPSRQKDPIEELVRKLQENLKATMGRSKKHGNNTNKSGGSDNKTIFGIVAGLIIAVWLSSGVYTVNTKEEAIVLRFGKYVRTTGAGLSYHLPAPIESVIKLRVKDRYRTEIGSVDSEPAASSRQSRRGAPPSSNENRDIFMLTGDENIIDVNFEVQWQIVDAHKFQFNVDDQQKTVRDAAESAMREIIGTTPLNDILSEGRTVVQLQTKELLQKILDYYDIGIKIEEVNMRATPPTGSIRVNSITTDDEGNTKNELITTTVDDSFKDVQAALINKEESINSAIARSNELIPQARGNAERIMQEAQGYKENVIARAEGDAQRFIAVYNEYKKAKDVTKSRIYFETMEDILSGMDKIVLDSKGAVPYLPLNEIGKKQ